MTSTILFNHSESSTRSESNQEITIAKHHSLKPIKTHVSGRVVSQNEMCASPREITLQDHTGQALFRANTRFVLCLLNNKGLFKSDSDPTQTADTVADIIKTHTLKPQQYLQLLSMICHYIKDVGGAIQPRFVNVPGLQPFAQIEGVMSQLCDWPATPSPRLDQIAPDSFRFDKKQFALKHTMICSPEGRAFWLISKIKPVTDQMSTSGRTVFNAISTEAPTKITPHSKSSDAKQLKLGDGTIGSVIPGYSISDDTPVAIKKIRLYSNENKFSPAREKCYQSEKNSSDYLINSLDKSELEAFTLTRDGVITVDHQQRFKGYLVQELKLCGDDKDRIRFMHRKTPFNFLNLAVLSQKWCSGVATLEKHQLALPDLKLENMLGGSMSDLSDIVKFDPQHPYESLKWLWSPWLIRTPNTVAPECSWSELSLLDPNIDLDQAKTLFHGYNRFSLGVMLYEGAMGRSLSYPGDQRPPHMIVGLPYKYGMVGKVHRPIRIEKGLTIIEEQSARKRLLFLKNMEPSPALQLCCGLGLISLKLLRHDPIMRISASEALQEINELIHNERAPS